MSNRVKNAIYTLVLLSAVFLLWKWRQVSAESERKITLNGSTMGTTYSVIVFGDTDEWILKREIDSLLYLFNKSLSTYDKESFISRFNDSDSMAFEDNWFPEVLKDSEVIFQKSEGAFDPTIMPLVRIWGFGPDESSLPDSTLVDSVKSLVGFHQIAYDNGKVWKSKEGVQLDFSAIAKGFGVDIVSRYLTANGYDKHFVEIGGEVRVSGINQESGEEWKIGITNPESARDSVLLYGILKLSDAAIATSGNYYNYYIRDGIRYSHTLDPDSGFPAVRRILSASVIAENCMIADGWATAFMVMGHEKAIQLLETEEKISGIILYSGTDGNIEMYISDELKDKFQTIL